MKFKEFSPNLINHFVNQEIDDFVHDKKLNSTIKYIYKIGAPMREKTYIITKIAKALGYKNKKMLLPFATAAELMMASAMNADDSIDDNKTRYGSKTLWLTLGKDKTHVVSNYIYGLLFKILEKYRPKTENGQKTSEILCDMLMDYFFVMHNAQYSTMSLGGQLKKFTLKNLEGLAEKKASILFEFCAYAPSLLANKLTGEMRKFGRLFGIALQYSSDLRDFVTEKGILLDKSKIRYEDLYTHQPNLVLALTAKSTALKKSERDFFIKTWTTINDKDRAKEKKVYSLVQKTGSVEKSKEILREVGIKLTKLISILPKKDSRQDLIDLVNQICKF